ncbi:hypothetical protein EDB19DRAFT_1744269 [Suillus lakei]|nr:hypothetical protein EDB19DRAFT_1744269 [Suillus lakei]
MYAPPKFKIRKLGIMTVVTIPWRHLLFIIITMIRPLQSKPDTRVGSENDERGGAVKEWKCRGVYEDPEARLYWH